jgi:hypothetical protein
MSYEEDWVEVQVGSDVVRVLKKPATPREAVDRSRSFRERMMAKYGTRIKEDDKHAEQEDGKSSANSVSPSIESAGANAVAKSAGGAGAGPGPGAMTMERKEDRKVCYKLSSTCYSNMYWNLYCVVLCFALLIL